MSIDNDLLYFTLNLLSTISAVKQAVVYGYKSMAQVMEKGEL